jgi:hypothetical protein
VYYKRKGGGAFSSSSHDVSYEFGLFMGCLCTILIPTCPKHFLKKNYDLISPSTFSCEFVLIPSQSFHSYFSLEN